MVLFVVASIRRPLQTTEGIYMAFNSANFSHFASGYTSQNGESDAESWKYTTTDNLSTVTASSYFDSESIAIRSQDWIFVKASDGVAILYCSVTYNSSVNTTVFMSSNGTSLDWGLTTVF
jgi:hypothetical protein